MNPYLQSELKQIQNRNEFFTKTLLESKIYLDNIVESQMELFCIYPNKMLEFNSSIDAFLWINEKSSEYYELFPLNDFDRTTIYQSFICIRNKWIRYNLAKWNNDTITHFTIPDSTINLISIFNTEKELIDNIYLNRGFFDYTIEYNLERSKQIKDDLLYGEWHMLYTNASIYKSILYPYDRNDKEEMSSENET